MNINELSLFSLHSKGFGFDGVIVYNVTSSLAIASTRAL